MRLDGGVRLPDAAAARTRDILRDTPVLLQWEAFGGGNNRIPDRQAPRRHARASDQMTRLAYQA